MCAFSSYAFCSDQTYDKCCAERIYSSNQADVAVCGWFESDGRCCDDCVCRGRRHIYTFMIDPQVKYISREKRAQSHASRELHEKFIGNERNRTLAK